MKGTLDKVILRCHPRIRVKYGRINLFEAAPAFLDASLSRIACGHPNENTIPKFAARCYRDELQRSAQQGRRFNGTSIIEERAGHFEAKRNRRRDVLKSL